MTDTNPREDMAKLSLHLRDCVQKAGGNWAHVNIDVLLDAAEYLERFAQPEPEATITEPRGCPTPGACSCPTAPFAPPELIRALELAEAALADIGDAERESGDDPAWAEARAAQDLPRIRTILTHWGSQPIEPVPEEPTVMEIIALADEIEAEELGQVDLVRRALARWGK